LTFGDANDPLLRALARLPTAATDEAREARVRARCHATLERTRLRNDPGTQIAEAALVGGLCVLYLSTVILEVIRLRVW